MDLFSKRCNLCGTIKTLDEYSSTLNKRTGNTSFSRNCKTCLLFKNKTKPKPPRANDYKRQSHLLNTYGISLSEYKYLESKQQSRCCICNCDNASLVVDHDHKTGRVRGLLCNHCNLALGHFKDSTTSLIKAVEYLEASPVLFRLP